MLNAQDVRVGRLLAGRPSVSLWIVVDVCCERCTWTVISGGHGVVKSVCVSLLIARFEFGGRGLLECAQLSVRPPNKGTGRRGRQQERACFVMDVQTVGCSCWWQEGKNQGSSCVFKTNMARVADLPALRSSDSHYGVQKALQTRKTCDRGA